ncbi:MAG: hypothetical protein QNJ47_00220 [Nostocaceae cyanobacterium]|nr:hypothetical protein [Nostocaceae cyanobacterium]
MTNFNDAIDQYQIQLTELKSTTIPSFDQVVQVLLIRDWIQEFIDENDDIGNKQTVEDITIISKNDVELKKQLVRLISAWEGKHRKNYLIQKNQLEKEIELYTKKPNSWWWKKFRTQISNWDRSDWIANTATVFVSIGATAIFTQTLQVILAIGSSNIAGTFVTLTQALLGVFFAGGTLTDTGKNQVKKWLDKISIPRHFHSEVTLLAAIVLASTFWGIKEVGVSKLEEKFVQQSQEYFNNNDFAQSIKSYKKLQIINPDSEISPKIGQAYELNLQLEQAKQEYIKGIGKKDAQSLIGLSRVTILQELLKSESGFLGKIAQGDITKIQLYIEEAKKKILDDLFKEIKDIRDDLKSIHKDKISQNVQNVIYFINEMEQDKFSRINLKYFHEVVLALDKINFEIKNKRINDFLSKLYTKDNQETKLLIEATIAEIVLNWSKVDFNKINLTETNLVKDRNKNEYMPGEFISEGLEENTPLPPSETKQGLEVYKQIYQTDSDNQTETENMNQKRKERYQTILIQKYNQLPEWTKLNCYLKIDKYLNTVDKKLNSTIKEQPVVETGSQIQKEADDTYNCVRKFRNNDSQVIKSSSYEVQLMFEVFNFADGKAQINGLISRD